MTPDLRSLTASIAHRAGAYALAERRGGVRVADVKSTPTDVVTAADRATEELIRTLITEARPDDAILGEEGEGVTGTSGLTWVIDPIDGTVNYLYDLPLWGVSVAVVEGDPDPQTWRAVAGAVAVPALDELFVATAGEGATCNDSPITCSQVTELSQSLIATGFAYSAERRRDQGAIAAQLLPQVRDLRRMGAASVDLVSVACGRLDGYYEQWLNPWDHAAGALIAAEAGALVSGRGDRAADSDLVLTAAPGIHQALREALDA